MNSESNHSLQQEKRCTFKIRNATSEDLSLVIDLDEKNTGLSKPLYWEELFERFGRREEERFFLVAEKAGEFVGFIIGEIRAWEFGSPPCGWIFALGVDPEYRTCGIGTQLYETICKRFEVVGIRKVRTMLARSDHLNMSFFRSQGLRGGPFIQLEKNLSK